MCIRDRWGIIVRGQLITHSTRAQTGLLKHMFNKTAVFLFKNKAAASTFSRGFASQGQYKIVFLRHGESTWNKENRFTGWTDVPLSETGIQEARAAGRRLKGLGYKFDMVYTSVLKRAIMTYNYCAEELDCLHLPLYKSWRLNERHYGALQGLNKAETAAKHGEQQVKIWRRSYDIPPPPLDPNDERAASFDSRYKHLAVDALPLTESLKLTVDRVLPYWQEEICSKILDNKSLLIVAHGNSIRAIVKYLDKISDKDILELNIPTGVPLVYELDHKLRPVRNYYLADEAELKQKLSAVANQGKAKQMPFSQKIKNITRTHEFYVQVYSFHGNSSSTIYI
eukprot:TRINITY_DN660_c0_g1_i2.p1 TRINITY_DN660_c0_g1~~TRINITY_DN660_c0_g1_i2.p1  ORF type:complete len:354 (+),score=95.04 TRINITY_DN660_c0_g1_i2:47-1063(+)